MTGLAVPIALTSAAGFAMSTSLQHRAAHSWAGHAGSVAALVRRLASDPAWLLGITVGAVAFGLHAAAVSQGALAVVQPIIVSGIVMAVPARAMLDRRRPELRELRWAAMTAAGLATFIVAVRPTVGSGNPSNTAASTLLGLGLAVAAVPTYCSTRSHHEHERGVLLGAAAGVLFGLLAGFMKLVLALSAEGGWSTLPVSWELWALIALGLAGMALNQRAYQAAPLSASMPILNVVAVLVAMTFGAVVFDEVPAHHAAALAGELAALVVIGLGLTRLFHSPAMSLGEPAAQVQR